MQKLYENYTKATHKSFLVYLCDSRAADDASLHKLPTVILQHVDAIFLQHLIFFHLNIKYIFILYSFAFLSFRLLECVGPLRHTHTRTYICLCTYLYAKHGCLSLWRVVLRTDL